MGMTYEEITAQLFNLTRKHHGRSLASALTLDQLTHRAHNHYPTVHVAGTNGKGGACIQLAYVLESAGYKVGLFTSPHIRSVRERLQINGQLIEQAKFTFYIERLLTLQKEQQLDVSFFDLLTFAAFQYFRDEQVDIAIIETGLGGSFDPTNVIMPLVSIITSVGFDHMHLLGSTLEAIGKEKGGIIKAEMPVVLGSSAALKSIVAIAKEKKAFVKRIEAGDPDKERERITRASIELLKERGFTVSDKALKEGLSRPLPFRYERVGPFILDGAHNSCALKALFKRLLDESDKPIHMILALGKEKGEDVFGVIKDYVSRCHIWPATHPRLMKPEVLHQRLVGIGVPSTYYKDKNSCIMGAASFEASAHLSVAGSYYILGSVKEGIKQVSCQLH